MNKPDPSSEEDSFQSEHDQSESMEIGSQISDDEISENEGEEDSDVEKSKRPLKRRKKNLFVETEAEVDEDDEEEEEDDYGQDFDFIDEADEAEALQPQIYRTIDRKEEEAFDEEEITKRLRERYGRGAYTKSEVYRGDAAKIPIQFLMPTNRDPRLWIVRCKPGREKDIAANIMRKHIAYLETPHRLKIYSVVFREFLKGYIYIEARSMADVQTALDKINGIYISRIQMVPLEEMTDVLKTRKKSEPLKEGSWARINRGKYKGDLAQILEVSEDGQSIRVRLIPRLDFTADGAKDGKRKSTKNPRPPQRLFNPKDVDKSDKSLAKSKGYWIWGADMFDKNGYLEKEMKLPGLSMGDVSPSLEELSRFSSANGAPGEYNGMASALSEIDAQAPRAAVESLSTFKPGDKVRITTGELLNAQGVIKSVDKSLITLDMNDNLLGEIQIESSKLEKCFTVGDQIKVVRGKFQGEIGMIVKVGDNTASVFSGTKKQFDVFLKDIQGLMAHQPLKSSAQSEGPFKLHDILVFNDQIGVVISIEREKIAVLDVSGSVQTISAAQVLQKRDPRQATAEIDAYGIPLHTGDLAESLAGSHERKQGKVLYLYRGNAFLYNKELVESSGVFVVKTRLLASISSTGPGNVIKTMPPPIGRPHGSVDRNFASRRNDPLLHQTIMITGGPFKGYQGIVKSVVDKGYRIELHTNAKIVTVSHSQIMLPGQTLGYMGNRPTARIIAGAQTPLVGSKTPNVLSGAQTPKYDGSRTPAWDAGARTPAWDAGARTPRFAQQHSETPSSIMPSETSRHLENASPKGLLGGWLIQGIEVYFTVEGELKGKRGCVISTDGRSGKVVLDDPKREIVASCDQVEPVPPSKKDRCIFLVGEDKGEMGTLIGMDGDDAIVKLDADAEFKVAALGKICKIRQL